MYRNLVRQGLTCIDAFNERRSASEITPGNVTSEQEPTEIWLRLRPSPVTLAKNGDPFTFLSPKRTEILYSPGAVGKYVTATVPSLLSL